MFKVQIRLQQSLLKAQVLPEDTQLAVGVIGPAVGVNKGTDPGITRSSPQPPCRAIHRRNSAKNATRRSMPSA